jgi:hypothetical protein
VFVRESTQAITQGLHLIVERDLARTPERRDRVCNSVVETPVQRTKLVRRNFGMLLNRYLGNGLANIPIFVNNLIDAVPEAQQFGAVQRRGTSELRVTWRRLWFGSFTGGRRLLETKRIAELLQK